MTALTDFLLARIAEDEEVARVATRGSRWTGLAGWMDREHGKSNGLPEGPCVLSGAAEVVSEWHVGSKDAEHIARHDPARVLAECEAKRRIVEAWRATWSKAAFSPSQRLATGAMADVLELLALPYADHPDYDEAWRP